MNIGLMKAMNHSKKSASFEVLSESRECELMVEIAAGSEQAFQELVAAVRPLILSVISRTIKSGSDVDDVCQIVLLSVWNGASRWEATKGRVSTWVASIARHRATDHVRKVSRAALMRERMSTEAAVLAPLNYGSAVDDDFMRLEARRMARRALSDLAPEQRHVLELAFIEGLTQVEVAERTGLPLGTAKARIRRGVMSMRRRLPHRMAA